MMNPEIIEWGCCSLGLEDNNYKRCSTCAKAFHLECIAIDGDSLESLRLTVEWTGPCCIRSVHVTDNRDNTPVRHNSNVTVRANKRPALSSPPDVDGPITRTDVRNIMEDVIQKHMSDFMVKITTNMRSILDAELKSFRGEINEVKQTMDYMNEKFEDIQNKSAMSQEETKNLLDKNAKLQVAVRDLETRVNNLEQSARGNNVEIQCLPEKKSENLMTVFNDICNVVKCDVKAEQINRITRIAKLNSSSVRPRSVVAEFNSRTVRDSFLAASIKFNKLNPDNKLNTSQLGYLGPKAPVFVTEHLSVANKALHSAARQTAKEKGFKFVWNAPNQEPVYRKVAIVENFFDIIYTVHVELEGRPGKHAGQKRTYRTITETYAFLPREAVTRFLTGCAECARRPRSASPPPLPTPSPSPTRHPTYLPFLPHCAPDYTRNWESEIDATHPNYTYEPKFDYTELQPLKKVESPKPTDAEDPEPTYIELTPKKVNGFKAPPLISSRTSPVEPAFREEEPVRADPEIDKDESSLIDVEDVKVDSPPPVVPQKEQVKEEPEKESTSTTEDVEVKENKTEKKEKKYNPLDVANLTAKDPPKSRSPQRKKLLPSSIEHPSIFGRYPKPWTPDSGVYYGSEEIDYSVPITTAYLKHMRNMAYQERIDMENKDNLTPEPVDMNEDDNFSSQAFAKDAEKLKMMLLAWNYHSQTQGRNGDITESGADTMADLWASYHSALGLGGKAPKPPTPLATGHSSPIHVGSVTPGVEPASTHDETSSSDRTKDDDDGGASDDDSDDRVDPQHHDPERLKAFNMFVRLFVDENLDRIVPISKQPKEKIQAIIDSCTRQFPEFAERARKRIRTYLKSCRRNKKVRGEGPTSGNGGATPGTGSAWDTAVRPTPAHLTSVQAEHILAQACENESLNAKRMRLGLDPVSQPMPTVPTPMAIDTTATSAVASSFLSLYSGAINSLSSTSATTTSNTTSMASTSHSKVAADTTRPSASPTLENTLLNNNNLKVDNANGSTGSKTASPASSPAPLFRPSFPSTFGSPQTFGRQNSNVNSSTALSNSALLSTLSALPPTGVNAAMAAYQSALLSAMAAHTHTFPTSLNAPTDLSLKTSATSTSLHATPAAPSLVGTTSSSQTKTPLLSHKLSGAEVGAVRQLITGYRESAAFLLRSADELETLLLNQP